MLSPYVRELSVGDMIRSSVRLYRSSFIPLLLCYVVPGIPAFLLSLYAIIGHSVPLKLLAIPAWLVCSLIGYAGITLCISDACTGNKPTFLRSLSRGRISLGPLILASVLIAPLMFLGFVWFLYVPIVVILERRGAWSAIKRSRQLSKGFNLRNLGVLVLGALMFVAACIIATILFVTVTSILGQIPSASPVLFVLIGCLGGILFACAIYPVLFIMIVLTYYDLRARKEGFDSMALAAELSR